MPNTASRDTRPLRPAVRLQVERLLAVSPEGRTIEELRQFLVTQRPASRDTITRVLHELLAEGLISVCPEPIWRRKVRARLAHKPKHRALKGRTHQLFTPTRALHARVVTWFHLPAAEAP